jgi:hypothetical protein
MRYVEGDRSIFVDSEVLAKPGAIALWSETIKRWDPPHDAEAVGPEDRSRIIENIQRAFESQGHELQVI